MQILQKDWQTKNNRIAGEMQQMLSRIDLLQEQMVQEANANKREIQLKEMDEITEQLVEYIQNISEMGQQLKLITDFVNHIRKGLTRVEGKINEMKKQVNRLSNDIKFLRGKYVEELFIIRKSKVLKEAANNNVGSIYVLLQTFEMLEKKDFRLLLIMDSYDEMKLENIQKNLYINNKLKQNWLNPLVIFTTRSEIFTSSNYSLWFEPEEKEKLKEIKLLKFDSKQMQQYLEKFTIQRVKMLIFEIYEWQTQISKREVIEIKKFEIFWEKLQQYLKKEISGMKGENLQNQK
ncbi:unnamed protein product [Paramecium primaurelia]|uniref:Uncharacterized protein n=1 Tax=Paramecium primaurelia TaxID=5886 RepID=A0A8S1N7B7_PARPR|nr:unnamed protein product [Paramecium primaurelia]